MSSLLSLTKALMQYRDILEKKFSSMFIKSSRDISYVSWIKIADVSGTISVLIIGV